MKMKNIMIGKYLLFFYLTISSFFLSSQCLNIKDLVDILNGKKENVRLNSVETSIKNEFSYKELSFQSSNSLIRLSNQDQLIIGSKNEYLILNTNECYSNLIKEVKQEIGVKVRQLDKTEDNSQSIETFKHLSKDIVFEFIEDNKNFRYYILVTNQLIYNSLNPKNLQKENLKQETTNKNNNTFIENNDVFTIVDEDAEYPGGYPAMMKFIQDNLNYPPSAIENAIQGKVFLKFIVEKNGQVSNVSVLKGISGCEVCEEEALRLTTKMNNWKPAKISGKSVRQWITLPITFALE